MTVLLALYSTISVGPEAAEIKRAILNTVQNEGDNEKLLALMAKYKKYKIDYAENIKFDSKSDNLSKWILKETL